MVEDTLPIFEQIPPEMATTNQLLKARLVRPKTHKAVAKLRMEFAEKRWSYFKQENVVVAQEKFVNLYLRSVCRPMTSNLALAEMDFYDMFVDSARRDRHLEPGSGRPVIIQGMQLLDEFAHPIWDHGEWVVDESGNYVLDEQGKLVLAETLRDIKGKWRYVMRQLTRCMIKDHINGKEYYGVFGGKTTRHFVIDLDLHGGDPDLFRRRLEILVPIFHAQYASHYSVSDGGVHLIGVFGKKLPLSKVRAELIRVLKKNDTPELGLLKNDGTPAIEIFPDPNRGIRLPLAKDRLVLLDQVLPNRQLRSNRAVPNVIYYMSWLNNPNRAYMSVGEVINLVHATVKPRSPSLITSLSPAVSPKLPYNCDNDQSKVKSPKQKGQFLNNLVKFWSGEITYEPGLFNIHLVMTTRLILASGLNDEQAEQSLINLCKLLQDKGFPSNTLNNPSSLDKHICQKISECRENKNLPDSEGSARKLERVVSYCKSKEFRIEDPLTWSYLLNNKNRHIASIIYCEPNFDLTEEKLIKDKLLPILKTDVSTAKIALSTLFKWIGARGREISSRKILPLVMKDVPNLSMTNHPKQRAFLKWLVAVGWLEVVREYSPKVRARKYGLGEEMMKRVFVNKDQDEEEGK